MKLLVLGATGATGRLLTGQALAAGHQVRALVRSPQKLTAASPAWRSSSARPPTWPMCPPP